MSENVTDIIFDLGNVLVPFDWEIAFIKMTKLVPKNISDLIIHDRRAFIDKLSQPFMELETGSVPFVKFYSTICDIIGLDTSLENFREIWCDIFWLDLDVVEVGRKLSRNYPCWLMSNTNQAHYEWIIDKFPEIRFYRKAALSYELGHMKPDGEYYLRALDLFGVDPEKAVFIDDIQENLNGAAVFGIKTIRFENANLLIQQLGDYGVIVST